MMKTIHTTYMRTRRWALLIMAVILVSNIWAQEVRVTIRTKRYAMPPAAMCYADNPGAYFAITLQNVSDRPINTFLGIELEQQGINNVSLTTPVKFSPSQGILLEPGQTKILSTTELRNLFRYINLNDVTVNGAIMSDFATGKQPMLPEGLYTGRVTAYEVDHQAERPLVLSDPSDGKTSFWVCYNCKAPQIISPAAMEDVRNQLTTDYTQTAGNMDMATAVREQLGNVNTVPATAIYEDSWLSLSTSTLDAKAPIIQWMAPQMNCSGKSTQFRYLLEITPLGYGRSPEEAIQYDAKIFTASNLSTTLYTIPPSVVKRMQRQGGYYVARVTAMPQGNTKNIRLGDYVQVENNGRSPLCIFKVEKPVQTGGTTKPDGKPTTPTVTPGTGDETDDGKEEEIEADSLDFVISKPHLTSPLPKLGVQTRILNTGDSICLAWDKPALVKGNNQERYDKLKFKYTVQLYKYKTGQPVDSMLVQTPIYTKEREELKDTIKWDKLEKSLERSEQLIAIVTAKITSDDKEVKVDSTDQKNMTQMAYLKSATETFADCNAGYSETIADKTLGNFTEAELKDQEVRIGEFTLIIDEIEKTKLKKEGTKDKKDDKKDGDKKDGEEEGEDTYKGRGYVLWKPYNKGFKISVEFDSLWINASKEVYRGKVRSTREPKALNKTIKEYIPYDMFDDLDDIIGAGQSKTIADKLADELAGKLDKYYKYMNEAADIYSMVTADGWATIELPIGLPRTDKDNPVNVQLFSAEFSPNTAWINVFAQIAIPECESIKSRVMAFTAPHICISPDQPLSSGIASLMGDFTFEDPKTNFGFTFRAPSQFDKPDDGTWISWSTDKAKQEMQMDSVQIQIEMSMNNLMKDDGKGKTVKGEVPVARLQTRFKDWGDWMALAEIDPFQSKELPGYTFNLAQGGMWYDHSSDKNPKNFKIPTDKGYKDDDLKDEKQWQGFWLSKADVQMPFEADESEKKEGEGGKKDGKKDEKKKDKKRVTFSVDDILIDKHGFTVDFNVNDVGSLNADGWSISLDHAYARIVQNGFKYAGMKGIMEIPLFDNNEIPYEAKMSWQDEEFLMAFDMQPKDDMSVTAWSVTTKIDKASRIHVSWSSKESFKIGALLSGSLTLDLKKKMGASMPGLTFKNMYIANYDMVKENPSLKPEPSTENSESDTEGKSHNFYYSIGEWGTQGLDDITGAVSGLFSESTTNRDSQRYTDPVLALQQTAMPGYGPAAEPIVYENHSMKASPAVHAVHADDKPVTELEVGGFKVALDKVQFLHENKFSHLGVYVKASGSLFYDQIGATVGMKLWANMNWDTYKLSYDDVKFSDIDCHGSLGGPSCSIDGSLKELSENGESGWQASLDFNLRELFKMVASGKYSKVKDDKHGSYHSFALKLGMKSATGIPLGVVSIDSIGGGFYYNSKLDMQAEYGVCAFALGVGMKTTGTSNLMNGTLDGLLIYNYEKKSLSKIRFDGKVHALCGTSGSKGLINSDVMVEYNNDDKERAFRIQATMQGTADEKALLDECSKFVGTDSRFDKLTKKLSSVSDMANDKLKEFGIGPKDANKSTEKTKDRGSIEGKGEIKASAGLKLSFDFAVVHKKAENKTNWHVYIGEPTRDKRCTLTLIDFQLGKKDDAIAAWCRIYANAYVCLGNELPNNGALPELPEKVTEYLYKKVKNVDTNNGTAATTKERRMAEFGKITTASGNSPGGVMFGAEAGGEFGVNAVLCYARADLVAGFDVAMLFARDMMCSNGKPAGKNGFYCNGQVYGYAGGQAGLMINTRLWSGKFPIIDVGIGALLKGGFVNPTWVYGKMKAHCKLLGGLIKFTSTIEVKAGDICLPVAKNPLEDIKIFSGCDPGSDNKDDGWDSSKEVSVFTKINFTTNMTIGQDLSLCDENIAIQQAGVSGDAEDFRQNAMRTFRFKLDPTMELYIHRISGSNPSSSGQLVGNYNYEAVANTNKTEFSMLIGTAVLEPNQCYRLELKGRGYEIVNGSEKNPLSIDQQKMLQGVREPWKDSYTCYFRTGPLSTNLTDYVQFSLPDNGAKYAPIDEARMPKLILKRDISSFMNSTDYEYSVELQEWDNGIKDWKRVNTSYKRNTLTLEPQLQYNSSKPYYSLSVHNDKGWYYQYDISSNKKYRYCFWRFNKNQLDKTVNAIRTAYQKSYLDAAKGNYNAGGNSVNAAQLTANYNNSTVDGVKLSADGKNVVVTGDDGKQYTMPLDTEYESIVQALKEYNEDFEKNVGTEESREKRINEIIRRKINKSAYMDQIYTIEFTAMDKTFQELVEAYNADKNNSTLKAALKDQKRAYREFGEMSFDYPLKLPTKYKYIEDQYKTKEEKYDKWEYDEIYNNAYYYLNYMANMTFLHGITLKKNRYYPNDITSAPGLGIKLSRPDQRGNMAFGSDGFWHGKLFETHVNVRSMLPGDWFLDLPEINSSYTDSKRRLSLDVDDWTKIYTDMLYDDADIANDISVAMQKWAFIYDQFWQKYQNKEKDIPKWVKLFNGTETELSFKVYVLTNKSASTNTKNLKSAYDVQDNGIINKSKFTIPLNQFPAMRGIWGQYIRDNEKKTLEGLGEDEFSFNDNGNVKLSEWCTGVNSKGIKVRKETEPTNWRIMHGWTKTGKMGYKNEHDYKLFNYKEFLKKIYHITVRFYRITDYNTDTGKGRFNSWGIASGATIRIDKPFSTLK